MACEPQHSVKRAIGIIFLDNCYSVEVTPSNVRDMNLVELKCDKMALVISSFNYFLR